MKPFFVYVLSKREKNNLIFLMTMQKKEIDS